VRCGRDYSDAAGDGAVVAGGSVAESVRAVGGEPVTHCAKVLALLSDGIWHSHHELYELHVMGHSRVADLRRKGYVIECKKQFGAYAYRLLSAPNDRPAGETTPPPHTPQAARSTGRRYETDGAAGATPAADESAAETKASSSMAVSAAEKTGSAQDPPTRGEGETQAAAGTSGASTPQTSLFDMPVKPAYA
jgi:hypothetical protein